VSSTGTVPADHSLESLSEKLVSFVSPPSVRWSDDVGCSDNQLDAVADVEKGWQSKPTTIHRCPSQEVVEPQGGADETPCVIRRAHLDDWPVNTGDVQQWRCQVGDRIRVGHAWRGLDHGGPPGGDDTDVSRQPDNCTARHHGHDEGNHEETQAAQRQTHTS